MCTRCQGCVIKDVTEKAEAVAFLLTRHILLTDEYAGASSTEEKSTYGRKVHVHIFTLIKNAQYK